MESKYTALSPLDGRYQETLKDIASLVSEAALIKNRIHVEAQWLLHLTKELAKSDPTFSLDLNDKLISTLNAMSHTLDDSAVNQVKNFEKTTNHDVKAVEYYLHQKLKDQGASQKLLAFIHFACTSEDINNLAYGIMLKNLRSQHILPQMVGIQTALKKMAQSYADMPMLGHTHGQPATPTTLGKELAVFGFRLNNLHQAVATTPIVGKMNGAVGCYNAHYLAFPEWDWPQVCQQFVEEKLGLAFNPLSTQIENHDFLAQLLSQIGIYNTISIGMCQDIWAYISKGYFRLKPAKDEVGSSTMPHKVNPIDFENAEGNFGLSASLGEFFCRKLPISRMQRDLSDSTVLRSVGSMISHHLLGQKSLQKGLSKIVADEGCMRNELADQWQVLGEALQTLLRKAGYPDAYELVKENTRGKPVTKASLKEFVDQFPELGSEIVSNLSPEKYLGIAAKLAKDYAKS